MDPTIDALQQFFAAINRNDIEAIIQHFDPQIVRLELDGSPAAGTYRGIAEVRENVRAGRGTWAEGSCEPERFLIQEEKVVVFLHAWVRLRGATAWTGGRFADGFVFRNGKITEYRTFGERVRALEWAGIRDEELA